MGGARVEVGGQSQGVADNERDEFWRLTRPRERPIRGQNVVRAAVHNRALILHHVRANEPISRLELAALTGLTAPAIFKISQDLLEEKYLVAGRKREGLRGQPTSLLSINPDAAYSIGVNVDRDHISIVLLDFGGHVRETFRRQITFASPAEVKHLFAKSYGWIEQNYADLPAKLVGIGLSMPDNFAPASNAHLKRVWLETPFEDLFAENAHLPLVVENDAAAAAIGEMVFGAGKSVNSFFYLYLSVGLGGGLVINRRYIRGTRGQSGELRFLPSVNPFRSSNTALAQSLESIVSLAGLSRALHDAGCSQTRIDHADMEDPMVRAVLNDWTGRAADLLYLPLLSATCVIDLDAIFVGGNLPAAVLEIFAVEVSKRLSINLGSNWPQHLVRPAKMSGDVAAIGAAVLGFRDLWDRTGFE